MRLPKQQAKVLVHMFERAHIAEPADTLDFRLAGEFDGIFFAGVADLDPICGYDARLVFTLANYSDAIFMAVTRGNATEVARALANLEDFERLGEKLSAGEIVRIPDSSFESHDLDAAILLLPEVLAGFDEFSFLQTIDAKEFRFFLVLFLTKEELEFKTSHGHDALMERFGREDRDVIVFP